MGVTARSDAEKSQVVIAIDGRFDFSQHKAFREAYKDVTGNATTFVIDLSDASYLDSSALGMLLLLREFVGSDPKRVRITGASEDVGRVLKIANFDKLFTVD